MTHLLVIYVAIGVALSLDLPALTVLTIGALSQAALVFLLTSDLRVLLAVMPLGMALAVPEDTWLMSREWLTYLACAAAVLALVFTTLIGVCGGYPGEKAEEP